MDPLQTSFVLLDTVQSNLYGLLGIIVVLTRFVRASSRDRQAFGLSVLVGGILIAELPYLVVSIIETLAPGIAIPGGMGTEPYTLFFIFTPLSFTYAILKTHKALSAEATPALAAGTSD